MATKYEQYGNSAFTYLRTAISASDLVVQVYDVRRFSNDTNTRVRIGNEVVRITAVDTENNTFTLVRGVEGTVAKAHNQSDLVVSVLTQGGLDQMLTDRVLYAKHRPQMGQISDKDGLKAEVADFTWHSQLSVTATDVNGNIQMNGGRGIGFNSSCLFLSTPSTPWTFTIGWRPFTSANTIAPTSHAKTGLTVKYSGSARMVQCALDHSSNRDGLMRSFVLHQLNAGSGVFAPITEDWQRRYDDIMWSRITDDGVDFIWDLSRDGVNWRQFYTEGRTAYLTTAPDLVGIFIDPFRSSASFGAAMDNFGTYVHASFT